MSNLLELPVKPTKANTELLKKLFIISHYKVGKTSNVMQLPDCLLIDLEGSSGYYDGMAIDVKAECAKAGVGPVTMLFDIAKSIREKNKENEGPVYQYIAIDTTSALEELSRKYATYLYKKTNMGKSFPGTDVVTELPKGAGYEWLRTAFNSLYKEFDGLAGVGLILLGHIKNSSITKDGKDLSARDVNLTGKLKTIVCADVDAVGFMYRNKETSENVLSFKTSEQDLATGARPAHLSGKEFIISKKGENDTVETYWEKVFTNLKSKK